MTANSSKRQIANQHDLKFIEARLGYLGLDVYEEVADVFFEDLSNEAIPDDQLARLLTFPNVVITGRQGFFTNEAVRAIAETTLGNITDMKQRGASENELTIDSQLVSEK